MSNIKIAIIATLLSLLLISACSIEPQEPTPTVTPTSTPISTQTPDYSSALPSIADVVEKVLPSVVYISVEYDDPSILFHPTLTKTGSGVILSPDGYILTNNHVVEYALHVEVLLPEEYTTYEAEIIGTDPLSDLAVIKIEGHNLPTASFADTSKLRIGDWVIAIGNALGLEGGPSVTLGIVSNLERSFPRGEVGESTFYDVIQTDADINRGNSGGPLVNLEGDVVGINTFVLSSEVETAGFAVNTSTARLVYEDLMEFGKVVRPFLGATLQTVTPALATELSLSKNRGVLVWFLVPDGPSDQAGLEVNDIITRFHDQEVDEASQLIKLLWQHDAGDSVKLTFWRDNLQKEAWVTLSERPDEP